MMVEPAMHARTTAETKALALKGLQASISARTSAGFDLKSPVCVYTLAEHMGVVVRFNDINMEGMYDRVPKPRVHLSALRPLARRAFTCAHELGHHFFGHGSTIDELQDDQIAQSDRPENEVLADAFAAFTLMPTLGIREALSRRGINPKNATPLQLFSIACNFGVGQATLVNHLTYAINVIDQRRRDALGRVTPKAIRADLLGDPGSDPLVIIDEHWTASTADVEVGTLILLPANVFVDTAALMPERDIPAGRLFRVVKTGISRIALPGTAWATYIRAAKRRYIGLARFRHLEEDNDE